MKFFLYFLVLILILSACSNGVDLSGDWHWSFTNQHGENHEVRVILEEMDDGNIKGYYCSKYGNGKYVDCNERVQNFFLERNEEDQVIGQFRSNNNLENNQMGKIEVTYLPFNRSLFFNIIQEPGEKFYFPDEVEFKRK